MVTVNVQRLISDISAVGDIAPVPGHSDLWTIVRFERLSFDPGVSLIATEAEFEASIRDAVKDAADVFPEVMPHIGAYRLLYGNLSEALYSEPPPIEIRIMSRGLEAIRNPAGRQGLPEELQEGDVLQWVDKLPGTS